MTNGTTKAASAVEASALKPHMDGMRKLKPHLLTWAPMSAPTLSPERRAARRDALISKWLAPTVGSGCHYAMVDLPKNPTDGFFKGIESFTFWPHVHVHSHHWYAPEGVDMAVDWEDVGKDLKEAMATAVQEFEAELKHTIEAFDSATLHVGKVSKETPFKAAIEVQPEFEWHDERAGG